MLKFQIAGWAFYQRFWNLVIKLFYVISNGPWGFWDFEGHVTTATVLRISSEKKSGTYLLSYLNVEGFELVQEGVILERV